MSILDAEMLATLNQEFEQAHPQAILRWAAATFGQRLAVVTSFQPTGIVTLHMLQTIAPDTPTLTLDTGLLFPETYALINQLEVRFNLNLKRIQPALSVDEQGACYGDRMWESAPNACCALRKIAPLAGTLRGYAAWMGGLRRDQSPRRASTPIVAWDQRYQNVKICPLATWTDDMVWAYIQAHDLPYNALHDQGYPSIGCWPCTQAAVAADGYSRAGRWSGQDKIECGIHLAGFAGGAS